MKREASITRKTLETDIAVTLVIGGEAFHCIETGIPFFNHMLTLFAVHGGFGLKVDAKGDLDVDCHHTVEDVGLVLGEAVFKVIGDRKGITRYGNAVTPMDETLATVTIDLSNRPYLVYNTPSSNGDGRLFDIALAKEFFRAFAVKSGMNLHINVHYGENEHHILEAIFKSLGRSLKQAVSIDPAYTSVLSSKGAL